MKKTSILTTTTLAGTLLFSGVGAHQAHAAESEVTANNATEIGSSVMKEHGYHPENVNFREPEDKGNYYLISYGNKSGAGVGAVRVYKDGLVKSRAGALASTENADLDKVGYYQFATDQNSTSSSNIVNNEQQNQTADSNISAQNSQQQYSSTTEENNNSQLQVENNSLPETGEQSNSGLVTVIASVLLAVGSLLTFKKTSKSN